MLGGVVKSIGLASVSVNKECLTRPSPEDDDPIYVGLAFLTELAEVGTVDLNFNLNDLERTWRLILYWLHLVLFFGE